MSLSIRLALMFALVSQLLLGGIGVYLYLSLQQEIIWRDDQALKGRLERIHAIIGDSDNLVALGQRPQLYENMLGNRDNLLWVLNEQGQTVIEINPPQLPIPKVAQQNAIKLLNWDDQQPTRLAIQTIEYGSQRVTLIAGKLLLEREQMLAAYILKIGFAVVIGTILAFMLGWLVSFRGLSPIRKLADQATMISVQNLHLRLTNFEQQHELAALTEALNQMLGRLENGFLQLSRFSEDLAHEMRTPLNNLMGQTSLALQQNRSQDEYQNLLFSNQEEYERLARMIDNMLFLARAEQSNASIKPEQIELHDLVAQLCDYFEGMAEERQVTLINQANNQLWAEPDLLRRALANLMANALRYGDKAKPIIISSQQVAGNIELSLTNEGPMIDPNKIEFIFDRFYRCDPSRSQAGDSGGLGLAIVRSIMQLHHGDTQVSSTLQQTCFTLIFPCSQP
ncbi:heavy metal sensor histidine kinase [Iodobacter sp. HSC-16F04]|uniref:Sensor protein n=1 Tax=Iodobacter violaceini TaxID=3044271 RepID=A0ABX0KWR1_9NEIS|nr:heavy metal sensor histidine kinase [Iodobacter violacea]NHQ86474.1 heavy metal sensor histidine kinase [Iodobacter violacea]